MYILCQVLGLCETQPLPMKYWHLDITEGLLVSLEGTSQKPALQVTVPGSLPQEVENKYPPVPKCIAVLERAPLLPHSIGFYPSWCNSPGREPGFGGGGAGFGAPRAERL